MRGIEIAFLIGLIILISELFVIVYLKDVYRDAYEFGYCNALKEAVKDGKVAVWQKDGAIWQCSSCKTHFLHNSSFLLFNHCPNCGATIVHQDELEETEGSSLPSKLIKHLSEKH